MPITPNPLNCPLREWSGRPVDKTLVDSLTEYVRRSSECPQNFRHWFLEVVLYEASPDVDIAQLVEIYMQNPVVGCFSFGPEFWDMTNGYRFTENWADPDPSLYSPEIPESYHPRPDMLRPSGQDEDGEAAAAEEADFQAYEDKKLLKKIQEITGVEIPGDDTMDDGEAPRGAQGETLPTALRLSPEPVSSEPPTLAPQGDVGEPLRTRSLSPGHSLYRGQRQPPLESRLETVRNFLADEDVDRCINWDREFGEVVTYLDWLKYKDENKQLVNAKDEVRKLFNEVVAMAQTHTLFEKHKYGHVPFEIPPPPTIPRRSTRLDWTGAVHDWPEPCDKPAVPKRHLPRSLVPREITAVNMMPEIRPEGSTAWSSFVRDTAKFWYGKRREEENEDNLAVIEAKAFDDCVEQGYNSGVPLGKPAQPEDEKSWAKERGVRRAALQYMLQRFDAQEQRGLPTALGRVSLPASPTALRKAREGPRGPQWVAPSLPRDQMPAQLETQPVTVFYRQYLHGLRIPRMEALDRLRAINREDANFVLLPRNLLIGGPLVWRGINGRRQREQDLLARCQTVFNVLKEAHRRAPRPLLDQMIKLVERGVGGEFYNSKNNNNKVPIDVHLADDEWDGTEEEPRQYPAYVRPEDLQWIKFLASDGASKQSWTGEFSPSKPKDKYRLFLIFAARVKKLLDDRNPGSLFGTHDKEVPVEQLLDAVNAGVGCSAVEKVEFGPYDAVAWLTRLEKSGHVSFRQDLACYGVVKRPVVEYYPEDRVRLTNGPVRPSYNGGVSDWGSVVRNRLHAGPQTRNFFRALAFRLGYTICMLDRLEQRLSAPSQGPTHTAHLNLALMQWNSECGAEAANRLSTLARGIDPNAPTGGAELLAWVRQKIIDETSANETMLAPGRERIYTRTSDKKRCVALVRDHDWDWASEKVRGRPAPRFMDINRWPQGKGYLSSDAKQAYNVDDRLDPTFSYNPSKLDPIDPRFCRPRLRRYGEDRDEVRFRPGRPVFPVGDTRHQQRVIEEYMTDLVHTGEPPLSLSRPLT